MSKCKNFTATIIMGFLFSSNVAQAGEWQIAQLVPGREAGRAQFVNGERFLTCDYKIPGSNIAFSITTTDFTCPYVVEYNMLTKNWRTKQ